MPVRSCVSPFSLNHFTLFLLAIANVHLISTGLTNAFILEICYPCLYNWTLIAMIFFVGLVGLQPMLSISFSALLSRSFPLCVLIIRVEYLFPLPNTEPWVSQGSGFWTTVLSVFFFMEPKLNGEVSWFLPPQIYIYIFIMLPTTM